MKAFPMGLRVLVVDDDPLCLMILERMLRRCSYSGEWNHSRSSCACPLSLQTCCETQKQVTRFFLPLTLPSRQLPVTTCNMAKSALAMLREDPQAFDLVISDVNMPDMDGFHLLELIGLEMDLPVISKHDFGSI